MDAFLLIVIVLVAIYLTHKIEGVRNLFESRIANTQQLKFDLAGSVLSSLPILTLAGLTKAQHDEDYNKWPTERKKKWESFLKIKGSNLKYTDLSFTITYLSHEDIFIVEAILASERFTYPVINRSPSNTYLFDQTLIYHPNKDKGEEKEQIRLEVRLRMEDNYYLISAGLQEFENRFIGGAARFTKLFDFPFTKINSMTLSDQEYDKFGFKVEKPSGWVDKDVFGRYTQHPWDTQIIFKHASGAEITYQR